MYQQFYQHFLSANSGKQHFACHSHHYWPDVTRDAMLEYWDDTARLVDDKWQYIFTEKVPQTQQLIADILQLPQPEQIVFAPNTHELVMRLLSCFDLRQPLHILTTDSEFHSFSRQVKRLAEYDNVKVDVIPTEPYATFEQRFITAAGANPYQLIFCSQVFFNSGVALPDLTGFVQKLAACTEAMIAIDGYHAFMALPTDLSAIAERIFYLAGSYKYAQGGEGCCFLAVPQGSEHRPIYTGWFAEFGELANAKQGQVQYANNGYRFAGATMDCSALYRVLAVFDLYQQQGLSVEKVQAYIQSLQQAFLALLDEIQHPLLNRTHLLDKEDQQQGQFLTFRFAADDIARIAAALKQSGIVTDYRGDRLRFGFALYHNSEQYDLTCLAESGN